MKNRIFRRMKTLLLAVVLTASVFTGCTVSGSGNAGSTETVQTEEAEQTQESGQKQETEQSESEQTQETNTKTETSEAQTSSADHDTATTESVTVTDASGLFTDRDLRQTADLSEAVYLTVADDETLSITEEGIYVISGTAKNAQIRVEAADEDKVQLVLDNVSIENNDSPCICVVNADKVFVTSAEGSKNTLSVTGTFVADGDVNTDAVIFSRDDLVLNGTGTVVVSSSDNGITCKDDLKLTGGTWEITAAAKGVEAKDSIAIADGTLTVSAGSDGLQAKDNDDDTTGWITINGGTITISAADDGIHAVTVCEINSGALSVTASEGIEATQVIINGGEIAVSAFDDGINAGRKSSAYDVKIEINGGSVSVSMGAGDTDAIDSNGDLIITGGTIDMTANSPFDYDGTCTYTGGTIIVNGEETNTVTNQMMGGGMGGGAMGGQGGFGGKGMR